MPRGGGYGLPGREWQERVKKLPKQFPMTHMKACALGIIRKLRLRFRLRRKTEAGGVRALVRTESFDEEAQLQLR